jgi:hypothetical protein
MRVQPIVEGHGDVGAVGVLLRRLVDEAGAFDVQIARPFRQRATKLATREGIQTAVRLAKRQSPCDGILIFMDADAACPKVLATQLVAWAREESGTTPCEVVLPHREFEAWFLAAIPSLRGRCGIRFDAPVHPDPEGPRGAKEAVEERMAPDAGYAETVDQPRLAALFDMGAAYRGSRSFRRLTSALKTVVEANGLTMRDWPPREWR